MVWLTACGHGDEVSGIVVIQEIFKRLRKQLRCGSIYAFPLMNPFGFEMVSRDITMSSEDLNRSFPGDPNGTLGERIANLIFTTITGTQPDLVLDLHNDWIESIPYVLLDRSPGNAHKTAYGMARNIGRHSGMCIVMDDEDLHNSLSCNLLINDIPALTLELGKSYVVSESNVLHGVEAISRILATMGMFDKTDTAYAYPLPAGYGHGKVLHHSDKPYGSRTGIIRFMTRPGEVISRGQPLARIVNAFGRHQETITAGHDAIVLGLSDTSAAFPGIPIMSFGVPGKPAGS